MRPEFTQPESLRFQSKRVALPQLQGETSSSNTLDKPYDSHSPSESYVHDPESLYNEIGQEQFLRSLLGMQLQSLSFGALCQLIRQLLLRSGYSSVRSCGEGQSRKTWGEGGLDLLAFAHTDLTTSLTAIQIKAHRDLVPRRFVDEMRGVMLRLRADAGIIVATSPFSALAKETAEESGLSPVRLLDGSQLTAMLLKRHLGVRQILEEGNSQSRWVFDATFFAALESGAKRTRSERNEGAKSPAQSGVETKRAL